jgi:CHAT domain-containing protein/Tfp pilus assembly protein PilF
MFQQAAIYVSSSSHARQTLRFTGNLIVLLFLLGHALAAAGSDLEAPIDAQPQSSSTFNSPQLTTLELGKPVERELSGSEEHNYEVPLAKGQYASLTVDQRGIDVVVRVLGPDGKLTVSFDNELRDVGAERIEMVGENAGNYRLVVKAKYPKLRGGRYEIRLLESRDANDQDRIMYEGRKLQQAARGFAVAGKYDDALPLLEKVVQLLQDEFGAEHLSLVYPLYLLGYNYNLKADYAKSEAFYQRGLQILERARRTEDPWFAVLLNGLSTTYTTKGEDSRAESLARRALDIREKILGPNHPDVAASLQRLALIYRGRGDFASAEPLFQRSLMLLEKAFGEDEDAVATLADALASLYREKGDYVKGEALYQRALTIWQKTRAPNHPYIAVVLNNLANLYRDKGDYEKAEPLYLRAIAIKEIVLGPHHPDLARYRDNLGSLYYARGDYDKAEQLFLSSLAISEKALGPDHPLVGRTLMNLANLYSARKEYAKAEPLDHRALALYEQYCGTNCPYLGDILLNLAKISLAKGQLAQAVAFQSRANAIVDHNLDLNLAAGSERQKLAFLDRFPEQLNHAISLQVSFPEDLSARELAALTVVQRKGRVQDALSNSLVSLRHRSSAEGQALLDHFNDITSQLARLILKEPREVSAAYKNRIKVLEEQREILETEISHLSAGFYQRPQPVTLSAIRSALPPDSALIEWAVYRPFDPTASSAESYGASRYVVYVIPKQGLTRSVELGPAASIDKHIEVLRRALRDPKSRNVRELSQAVDEEVMRPVRALTGDAKKLLVSPDGELNLIPFEALVDEQGRYLIERYSFSYLTSGRDLLRMQVPRPVRSNLTVVANPAFGEPPFEQVASAANGPVASKTGRRSVTTGHSISEIYFAPLSASEEEGRAIQALYPETKLLRGSQATESALKESAAPKVLHLATHGFFLENPDISALNARDPKSASIKFKDDIENPLLRSGLAFAGANARFPSGKDDGIMTALEASGLNLWGTKLVVLSACDTGIGEIRNGEGIYGLRRAFILAGAESLVMSLWPISDYSTRKLMVDYYKNLKLGMGRGEALRRVQLNLLQRNRDLHPFYWANFIQSGEWANLDGKR